jgi:hypothetical protein
MLMGMPVLMGMGMMEIPVGMLVVMAMAMVMLVQVLVLVFAFHDVLRGGKSVTSVLSAVSLNDFVPGRVKRSGRLSFP